MKLLVSVVLLNLSLQASTAACQLLVLPSFLRTGNSREKHTSNKGQLPIMNIPNILFPPSSNKDKDGSSGGSGELSISDVIGKERVISIFAGFTRDIDSISKRLDANDQNTTVLAPLNSELQKLPRKPWEDPEDYNELGASAYEGQSGEDRAQRNLRRFVEAHAVPMSPWKEGEKVNSIGGGKLWWEEKDGKKVVQPGNIEVSSIASKVSNGEVEDLQDYIEHGNMLTQILVMKKATDYLQWIMKGCLNYASAS